MRLLCLSSKKKPAKNHMGTTKTGKGNRAVMENWKDLWAFLEFLCVA
jgi:hypothetical protein